MQRYIGTKIINAEPMNRQKYNDFRGWTLPEDEDGMDEGYLVEYLDGGKPNTDKFEGYVSWSPKEQFEKAYRQSDNLSFGLALEALKDGKRIARAGWNGKDMWLSLSCGETREVSSSGFWSQNNREYADSLGGAATVLPCITMKVATGEILMGWLASQSDMLGEDWVILE
jgi:hypothetical protein